MSDQDQITEMLTTESPAPRHQMHSRLVKVAGVSMAGLLALSACASVEGGGEADDDSQDQTEATGEETAEDEGVPEEEEAPEEAEVPDFEDIADDVFDAMEAQDNVTIVGEGAIWEDEVDDLTEDGDADAEQSFTVRGDIGGEDSEVDMLMGGESMNIISVDGQVFVPSTLVSLALHAEAEAYGEEDLVDWDALNSDLEGTWMDGSTVYLTGGFTADDMEEMSVSTILEEFREGFEDETDEDDDEDGLGSFGEAPEGELDERDGQEVWVYSEDDTEVVVAADEEEPLLLTVESVDQDGNDVLLTFDDWNETEVEAPEDGNVLDDTDFEDLLLEHADEELIEQM